MIHRIICGNPGFGLPGILHYLGRPHGFDRPPLERRRGNPGPWRQYSAVPDAYFTATQQFRELTETKRPQDPHGDGIGLRFETGERGGDYPDNMPQPITMTDAQGR